jgi:hypothetical protein
MKFDVSLGRRLKTVTGTAGARTGTDRVFGTKCPSGAPFPNAIVIQLISLPWRNSRRQSKLIR